MTTELPAGALRPATTGTARGHEGSTGVVERFYAAIDDLPALVELVTPDVVIRYPAAGVLAYGGDWHGTDEVVRFLNAHDDAEEIVDLELRKLVASGEVVVALGLFRGRAKPAGRPWTTEFVHAFTIQDGRIRRFQAFFDTAAALEAHRLTGA